MKLLNYSMRNFVDGLWSASIRERFMVFTMNHPERLDEALLRTEHMDRKNHLLYCMQAGNVLNLAKELPGSKGGTLTDAIHGGNIGEGGDDVSRHRRGVHEMRCRWRGHQHHDR
ncbi:hypothetical protein ZIOFF_059615 [Zingiber officinale]|uniref:ATPase AAA-type core domain-containing protein n=1 Tax=Zingiber officinale TaxID=94328 RepID=A0A8J5FFH0_ZINOF|nr:hypothetical protein ZIOFF_059615 [Zingiber officinale]